MARITRSRGVTLLELVVVIVLLGIIAAGSLAFLTRSTQSYVSTAARADLASTGRLALERITRELRNALPNSVRTNASCIEFMPVIASGNYQDRRVTYSTGTTSAPLPVAGAGGAAVSFDALAFLLAPQPGQNYYVAVYPLGPGAGNGDPYSGSDPGALFPYAGQSTAGLPSNVVRLTMDAAHRFSRGAPMRRLFVVGEPVSFCVSGTNLYRYTGYGVLSSQPTTASGALAGKQALLAQHIQLTDNGAPVTPFEYSPGTLYRTAVVRLDLRFMRQVQGGEEWARLSQEVQIRNVP
ncbi:MAG TPA: prepilin-type N-terminal cleavage/methylation domain-containing protein [Gammaproteobacteria bacterium]|nr:prepilin-type N-terminal cleavage/methylation domain-containing protein [Gammaproteobacteria bacterium]